MENEIVLQDPNTEKRKLIRNLAGFWLLGLTNNFGYVVMLSSAYDLLTPSNHSISNSSSHENRSGKLIEECNPIGTGAILLADILPSLVIKLSAPFYLYKIPHKYRIPVILSFSTCSFLFVSLGSSKQLWLRLLGVILASATSGLGEITYLSLTSYFNKNCVSTWSSGTGAAGLFGSITYLGLIALGLAPNVVLLIMLIIPATMAMSYYIILTKPTTIILKENSSFYQSESSVDEFNDTNENALIVTNSRSNTIEKSWRWKLLIFRDLLKLIVPLFLVYVSEYFINQALYELIVFNNIWLSKHSQYRWYQVLYQLGVFISRSSVNIIYIRHIWIFSILQYITCTLLLCQVFLKLIPSIWGIFFIVLFEGLVGGGAYVNTFYRLTREVSKPEQEFSLTVTCISDSLGVTVAGFISIPIHNLLCSL